MKFFFRITDINLVSERFDYFEPSLANSEDPEDVKSHLTNRNTPAKAKQNQQNAIKTDSVNAEQKEIKTEEDTTSDSLTSGDKTSANGENKVKCEIKKEISEDNSEISECSKASDDKKEDSDIVKQSKSEYVKSNETLVPEKTVPTFKNCLADIKKPALNANHKLSNGADCTQELTIKTNNFTNILGCDPKTNSTLINLQKQKYFVPTLLKAVPTPPQKSPKNKQSSTKKTEKLSKSTPNLQKTIDGVSKRLDLPTTVEHTPKSFENIFKPNIKTDATKKSDKSKSESFSKTLKSIHETIKNFPRGDTPPMILENRINPIDPAPKTTGITTEIRTPITSSPKKVENGHSKLSMSRSPSSPSTPEVIQKLNEQIKLTENLLNIVRNASKASAAKSHAVSSNGHLSPRTKRTEPTKTDGDGNEIDKEKTKFLKSIQLTAKSSLPDVPKPIVPPVASTAVSSASISSLSVSSTSVSSTSVSSTTLSSISSASVSSPTVSSSSASLTPVLSSTVSSASTSSGPISSTSLDSKAQTTKRKYSRKDKPMKRIKLSPTKIKICTKIPKMNPKILPKPNKSIQLNVKPEITNVNRIATQPETGAPKSNQLQSLFDSCNINIPSSLSITLTESPRSEDGSVYESKPTPIKPVQNYIEILKLPDTPSPTPGKNVENPLEKVEQNQNNKTDVNEKELSDAVTSKAKADANLSKKQLTFQTMFEEAIKKNESMKNHVFQVQTKTSEIPKKAQVPIAPKTSPLKPKKNQNNALDLSKTSPKSDTSHKRNILEIAHQLSKKSRLEAENSIAKSPLVKTQMPEHKKSPTQEESKKINIVNSNFNSGGSISIQKKVLPQNQKLPIPRLPVQKAPTLKLGPSNARAVPKPVPKTTPKTLKSPKPSAAENTPVHMNSNLSPNQILEKYNITSLQQLNANISQAQLAFQQALMMSHQLELQRLQANQKHWLANPNVLAHYESYVQSLKNQQNQLCGNANKN